MIWLYVDHFCYVATSVWKRTGFKVTTTGILCTYTCLLFFTYSVSKKDIVKVLLKVSLWILRLTYPLFSWQFIIYNHSFHSRKVRYLLLTPVRGALFYTLDMHFDRNNDGHRSLLVRMKNYNRYVTGVVELARWNGTKNCFDDFLDPSVELPMIFIVSPLVPYLYI